MINVFFPFFACFSKTIGFGSVFSAEMNFACKNTQNKHIFIGFAEKSHLPFHFFKAYSLAIFLVIGQKLISTNLAIFGFFDSVGIRHFWLI